MDSKMAWVVLEQLERNGYEAYLVGGCVRDRLLKKTPRDYDITTNAKPHEICPLFNNVTSVNTTYGVVTVCIDNKTVDISTYRIEKYHQDRLQIIFTSSLEEDLRRRDFTINALAQDRFGRIYDFFDGCNDIESGKLQVIGKPIIRFGEDPLRMLRLARFVCDGRFGIDRETKAALIEKRDSVSNLSVERVQEELNKMFTTAYPSIGLQLLIETGIISWTPPIKEWRIKRIENSENIDMLSSNALRWAYFIYSCKSGMKSVEKRVLSFDFQRGKRERIKKVLHLLDEWSQEERNIKKRMLILGYETVCCVQELYATINNQLYNQDTLQMWCNDLIVTRIQELKIDGNDLTLTLNQEEGPWIKETLQYLLEQVAFGHLENEKQLLLERGTVYAKK